MHHGCQALVDSLPGARLIELEGEFHALKPEVLAPAVSEYFAQAVT